MGEFILEALFALVKKDSLLLKSHYNHSWSDRNQWAYSRNTEISSHDIGCLATYSVLKFLVYMFQFVAFWVQILSISNF